MKIDTQFSTTDFKVMYPDGIEYHYWHVARNKIILHAFQQISAGQTLDIGSGRGLVTDYLFKNKVLIQGVELGSTTPINQSNVPIFYNTNVFTLSADLAEKYQTISMFDVLEHIEDPVDFLKKLNTHFKNIEYLIITVPARKELWTNFDNHYGHFRRYDLEQLKTELNTAGFEQVHSSYFFHLLYVLIYFSNLIFKNRKLEFKPVHKLARIIHKLLGELFYLDYVLLPKRLAGSSILCIAKKKLKVE